MTELLLTATEATVYLEERYGITRSVKTLAKQRCAGGGPRFVKLGKRQVRYLPSLLDEHAAALISAPRASTSEAA